MNSPITITVEYQNPELNQCPNNLYLRILPVFTDPEHHHEPVNRCKHHSSATDHHILACKNNNARLEGHPMETDYGKRLSVVLPMCSRTPEVKVNVTLEFYCQNSCATGINRRATALIFVLETERQEIVGKRLMYFKVCSCPKRDQQKEQEMLEQQMNGGAVPKRRAENQLVPGNGKRPCKIIKKVEIKQEFPTPSQTPTYAQLTTDTSSTGNTPPGSNSLLDSTISYTLNVADHDALLRILQSAADIHGVMAVETSDDEKRRKFLKIRGNFLHEKEMMRQLVQQIPQSQQETQDQFEAFENKPFDDNNYMQ